MSAETTLRHIETLRCLPVGKWRTTRNVCQTLRALGYKVTKRTIERDLRKLAKPFSIEIKEWGGGLGNEWRRTLPLEAEHDVPANTPAPSQPVRMSTPTQPVHRSRCRTMYAARRQRASA